MHTTEPLLHNNSNHEKYKHERNKSEPSSTKKKLCIINSKHRIKLIDLRIHRVHSRYNCRPLAWHFERIISVKEMQSNSLIGNQVSDIIIIMNRIRERREARERETSTSKWNMVIRLAAYGCIRRTHAPDSSVTHNAGADYHY